MYQSTKTYGHDVGLSCCFRQWRADSHCAQLHGYALSISLVWRADELDERNWVVDFGGLKDVKRMLQATFDHTLVIAADDPQRNQLFALQEFGVARIVELADVGCEKFAEAVFEDVSMWTAEKYGARVELLSVEVREHGGNSALYVRDDQ